MKNPQHKRPIWLGLLLAAVCIPLGVLAVLAIPFAGNPGIKVSLDSPFFFIFVGLPFSSVAVLALGLPLVLILRALNALNWVSVCSIATVIGALALPIIFIAISPVPRPLDFSSFVFGGALGLAGAVAFCIGSGPNNSFKPKPLRGSA